MSSSEVEVGNRAAGGCLLGNWVEEVSADHHLNIEAVLGIFIYLFV